MRALLVLVTLFGGLAHAHQTSVKYVELAIHDSRVDVTLRCAASAGTEPMQLATDATPATADAVAHPAVASYVQRWLALQGCTASTPTARAFDAKFVDVTWTS